MEVGCGWVMWFECMSGYMVEVGCEWVVWCGGRV